MKLAKYRGFEELLLDSDHEDEEEDCEEDQDAGHALGTRVQLNRSSQKAPTGELQRETSALVFFFFSLTPDSKFSLPPPGIGSQEKTSDLARALDFALKHPVRLRAMAGSSTAKTGTKTPSGGAFPGRGLLSQAHSRATASTGFSPSVDLPVPNQRARLQELQALLSELRGGGQPAARNSGSYSA